MAMKLQDKWVWDSWYAHDGNLWHGYFLQAPRDLEHPDLRHWHVSQGHATSEDLIHWNYMGTGFEPADGPAWDDCTTWTGSVVQADDGVWHLFYTGTRQDEEGLYQRIGHAVSSDMHHWERIGDGFCLDLDGPNADCYEVQHKVGEWHDRAMRDPWVIKDPAGNGWLMFFTARASGIAEDNAAGAIGFATSENLQDWTLQPPVYIGGFGQLEVPEVFEKNGYWYCVFCTSAEFFSRELLENFAGGAVTGSHYLMADNPRGPWRIAPGPFLDGGLRCERFAARIVDSPAGLQLMGFADRNQNDEFLGYLMDPQRVIVDSQGLMKLQPEENL